MNGRDSPGEGSTEVPSLRVEATASQSEGFGAQSRVRGRRVRGHRDRSGLWWTKVADFQCGEQRATKGG